jgi:hypothetical protein
MTRTRAPNWHTDIRRAVRKIEVVRCSAHLLRELNININMDEPDHLRHDRRRLGFPYDHDQAVPTDR